MFTRKCLLNHQPARGPSRTNFSPVTWNNTIKCNIIVSHSSDKCPTTPSSRPPGTVPAPRPQTTPPVTSIDWPTSLRPKHPTTARFKPAANHTATRSVRA